jgi:hypothetical protein
VCDDLREAWASSVLGVEMLLRRERVGSMERVGKAFFLFFDCQAFRGLSTQPGALMEVARFGTTVGLLLTKRTGLC